MAQILKSIEELRLALPEGDLLVATLGFFDGVHLGHQMLIRSMLEKTAKDGARSLIITLDQHPGNVLAKRKEPAALLMTQEERLSVLEHAGADYLLILPFTPELARLSVEEFLKPLISINLVALVLGYDNRFGKRDNGETMAGFDKRITDMGIELQRVKQLRLDEELPVSSSSIRASLAAGDFISVERLLGRPFSLRGHVAAGRQIGRTIGYPTANVVLDNHRPVLPKVGVYIAEVLAHGRRYAAMAYYGSSPTVTGGSEIAQRLEVFLLDFEGDLYGHEMEVGFRLYLRGDVKFDSLEELEEQLKKDEKKTRSFFESQGLTMKSAEEVWRR